MINRKISKILGHVAGVIVFMLTVGAVSIPVYAAESIIDTQCIYNEPVLDKDTVISNNVIEQNGVKFTVSKITGTKHKMEIEAKIEREEGLGELDTRNMKFNIYMDDTEKDSGGASWGNRGSKTIFIEAHNDSEEGFPEKGNIRADLIMGEYDFNGSLIIPVDFTESFKEYMEKDINTKITDKDSDINIKKFESDTLGTRIIVSRSTDISDNFTGYSLDDTKFIIKVDNKLYITSFSDYVNSDENEESVSCEVEGLTYNMIKDAKSISVLPISCTMSSEEIQEFFDDNDKGYSEPKEETVDNINFIRKYEFTDGTNGEIKPEKYGDKVKVTCSSDSELKSLLMALCVNGFYNDDESYYGEENGKTVYKDPDNEHQYVAEFNNSYPNVRFQIYTDGLIANSDKFKIGDEIKIK